MQAEEFNSGAKNSTLPSLAASIICGGETVLTGCPRLSDVDSAVRILELLGVSCSWSGDRLIINAGSVTVKYHIHLCGKCAPP